MLAAMTDHKATLYQYFTLLNSLHHSFGVPLPTAMDVELSSSPA